MEAKVTWVEDQRYVGQATSGHGVVVDASGEKVGPSPMELVLMGMAACTAYDVIEILKKKRQAVAGLEVQARAERAQAPPRVYTAIAVEYVVRGRGVQAKAVEDAIRLSLDKYCSVSNMLNQTATITSEYRIEESD